MYSYAEPFYRQYDAGERWKSFRVKVETSDIHFRATVDCAKEARQCIERYRDSLRSHMDRQDSFLTSLVPVRRLGDVPEIVSRMYRASERAGVGPMASVAGALAEMVGAELVRYSDELIVENGGDVWMSITRPITVSVLTGAYSPLAGRVGIQIDPDRSPLCVCTSSGRIGHSLSLGRADAATVLSSDGALADAAATFAGNLIKSEDDMAGALDRTMKIEGVSGVLIIYGKYLAVRGDIELTDPRLASGYRPV